MEENIDVISPKKIGERVIQKVMEILNETFSDHNIFVGDLLKYFEDRKQLSVACYLDELDRISKLTEWGEKPIDPVFKAFIAQSIVANIAISLANLAIKNDDKNCTTAWIFACEAMSFSGYFQGIILGRVMGECAIPDFSALGSNARHAETRSMKNDAFEWCSHNFEKFKSMDSAAIELSSHFPVVLRTVRKWVGEWKKLQSAGRL